MLYPVELRDRLWARSWKSRTHTAQAQGGVFRIMPESGGLLPWRLHSIANMKNPQLAEAGSNRFSADRD
jgi:hypothetical protein